MFSKGQFDKAMDKATSPLLLEPDWLSILALCDSVRGQDITPKYAIAAVRKRLLNDNPHVVISALQVLESMAKNCGSPVHDEIASKDFLEFLKDQAKARGDPVKGKILELIQLWSHAFRNQSKYLIVCDTYTVMKGEGYKFPPLREADAMFASEVAPEWKDGDTCHRCRSQFSTLRRKHHCRNCGNIFCGECSSKYSTIPKYGIEKEVRVCDTCYDVINKTVTSTPSSGAKDSSDLPPEYLTSTLSKEPQQPARDRDRERELELQEKEELELALALSASEAENQAKDKARQRANYSTYGNGGSGGGSGSGGGAPTPANQGGMVYSSLDTSEMDPELARYLNRNYWESKSAAQPSAPAMQQQLQAGRVRKTESPLPGKTSPVPKKEVGFVNGSANEDLDKRQSEFLSHLHSCIEIFMNRMKSNSQRGRLISNDSSVQTLFLTLNAMHPELLQYIKTLEERRTYYENLQDKLAQQRDAREALNALRDENAERRRQEAMEQARIRQIQMQQKLEIMRQKKQEYLDYQRQLALQRMQEQEQEMAMRLEQQKQMQQMRQYQQQYPFSASGQATGAPSYAQQPGYMPQGGYGGQQQPQMMYFPSHQPNMGPASYQGPPGGMPPASDYYNWEAMQAQQSQMYSGPATMQGGYPMSGPPPQGQHSLPQGQQAPSGGGQMPPKQPQQPPNPQQPSGGPQQPPSQPQQQPPNQQAGEGQLIIFD